MREFGMDSGAATTPGAVDALRGYTDALCSASQDTAEINGVRIFGFRFLSEGVVFIIFALTVIPGPITPRSSVIRSPALNHLLPTNNC